MQFVKVQSPYALPDFCTIIYYMQNYTSKVVFLPLEEQYLEEKSTPKSWKKGLESQLGVRQFYLYPSTVNCTTSIRVIACVEQE